MKRYCEHCELFWPWEALDCGKCGRRFITDNTVTETCQNCGHSLLIRIPSPFMVPK